jgi:hypothetical protein
MPTDRLESSALLHPAVSILPVPFLYIGGKMTGLSPVPGAGENTRDRRAF